MRVGALILLLCLPGFLFAGSNRVAKRAERTWLKASGVILSERMATGSWQQELDPALSGLIGPEFGSYATTLGKLSAKQTAAQSGWCRVIACMLDSLDIGSKDTVAVTMTGSFPGLNLAVLSTLEAAKIPYRCVISLGASTFGACDSTWNWPKAEALLKEKKILKFGSLAVTPGGSGDRMTGLPLETALHANDELRGIENSFHPNSLRQAVLYREHLLGPVKNLRLLINVGGGHAALGSRTFGHHVRGGYLDENSRLLLESSARSEGIPGLMETWFEKDLPVLHLVNIEALASDWGLPICPQKAQTPKVLNSPCQRPSTTVVPSNLIQ
jgi:poly-gamma-glutamate system protein